MEALIRAHSITVMVLCSPCASHARSFKPTHINGCLVTTKSLRKIWPGSFRFHTRTYDTPLFSRGGDLGGTGGRSPQNLRWGDGPCIGPPNILRSSVVGWARKLGESKNRCRQVIFLLKEGFLL